MGKKLIVIAAISLCLVAIISLAYPAPEYSGDMQFNKDDLVAMSAPETEATLNSIIAEIVTLNSGVEPQIINYINKEGSDNVYTEEAVLLGIDNALTGIQIYEEKLKTYNFDDSYNSRLSNIQLSITAYETALEMLKTNLQHGNKDTLNQSLDYLRNAISNLSAS